MIHTLIILRKKRLYPFKVIYLNNFDVCVFICKLIPTVYIYFGSGWLTGQGRDIKKGIGVNDSRRAGNIIKELDFLSFGALLKQQQ